MKPYTDINGKAKWILYWGDKVKKQIRKSFKKSARKCWLKENYINN